MVVVGTFGVVLHAQPSRDRDFSTNRSFRDLSVLRFFRGEVSLYVTARGSAHEDAIHISIRRRHIGRHFVSYAAAHDMDDMDSGSGGGTGANGPDGAHMKMSDHMTRPRRAR